MPRTTPQPPWRHPEFARGARDMAGPALGIAAWGLVTGVAMVKSGLPLPLAVLMSLLVFAGSAQLATLPLMASGAPIWVVWATALCVNLRFVIFSAAWRPYFGALPRGTRLRLAYFTADLNYVLFMKRFPEPRPAPEQLPYFWGGVALQLAGLAAAVADRHPAGDAIPTAWGLGFAGMLALLGLDAVAAERPRHRSPPAVAACAAVAAYALPLKLNIVVAIAAAVAIGLLIDHTTPRPAAAAGRPHDDTLGGRHHDPRPGADHAADARFFLVSPTASSRCRPGCSEGLRYAPLAALAAVVVPEIVLTQGELIAHLEGRAAARRAAGAAYFFWRRGILGTILCGMAVLLPLKVLLGW